VRQYPEPSAARQRAAFGLCRMPAQRRDFFAIIGLLKTTSTDLGVHTQPLFATLQGCPPHGVHNTGMSLCMEGTCATSSTPGPRHRHQDHHQSAPWPHRPVAAAAPSALAGLLAHCWPDVEKDHRPVQGRPRHDAEVPDLVEAEPPRKWVWSLQGEDHTSACVDHPT